METRKRVGDWWIIGERFGSALFLLIFVLFIKFGTTYTIQHTTDSPRDISKAFEHGSKPIGARQDPAA